MPFLVHGTYDLMLHSYGPSKIMGAANIQVDEHMTAKQIHGLSKRIQGTIYKEFGIILILFDLSFISSNSNFLDNFKDSIIFFIK